MGEVKNLRPKQGYSAKEYLKHFLEEWGDQLESVVIIGMHKDGDVVDGWSKECQTKIFETLGMVEQTKLDFWDAVFTKRSEVFD